MASAASAASTSAVPVAEPGGLETVSCGDVRVFTNVVRASQKADDNVTHWLNRTEARTAAQCSALFRAFAEAHTRRAAAVQRCVHETAAAVDTLAQQAAAPDADAAARSRLTAARAKLRHLQTELAAEAIVAEETVARFRDRCGATGLAFDLLPHQP